MSRTKVETTKLISLQTMASSFVGIMAAVPLAFALVSPMSASAETTGVTLGDLEKFAYALGQGQQASLANVTTGVATVCTEDAVVKAGATTGKNGDKAGAAVVLGAFSGNGGSGGVFGGGGSGMGGAGVLLGGSNGNGNGNGKLASTLGSYYHYSNTVHNSSTVSNVNSNNTVGSHNSTSTKIGIEDAKNVKVSVDNNPSAIQKNANESFNNDSYNTKTFTKTDIDNTNTSNSNNTTTTNMKAITKTTNVDVDVDKTIDSNNTTTTNNGSFNETELEVEIDAEVNILSKNDIDVDD